MARQARSCRAEIELFLNQGAEACDVSFGNTIKKVPDISFHIAAAVLLVSRKSDDDMHRWVYLDIGKFSGRAETMDEAIRYQCAKKRDDDELGPCILAGPSCHSADVLYEKRPMMLPVTLSTGDKMMIRNCGAYTPTFASIGFNGFPPLDVIVL